MENLFLTNLMELMEYKINICILLAFLIKIPIVITHDRLLKAHIGAPVLVL